MDSAESYYTDVMRQAVASVPNPSNYDCIVSVNQDAVGYYICVVFPANSLNEGSAKYLLELRRVLQEYSRVTFWPVKEWNAKVS